MERRTSSFTGSCDARTVRIRRLASNSVAGAVALALLTGCSGPSATPAGASGSASALPAADPGASPAEEQIKYNQTFVPLGDCHWSKNVYKFHHIVKSASITMNAGNNGYCTFPLFANNGGDFSSEVITNPPIHGSLKFLPLTHRLLVGYLANAGYVGADAFDITVTRVTGISTPVNAQVTVANPAPK